MPEKSNIEYRAVIKWKASQLDEELWWDIQNDLPIIRFHLCFRQVHICTSFTEYEGRLQIAVHFDCNRFYSPTTMVFLKYLLKYQPTTILSSDPNINKFEAKEIWNSDDKNRSILITDIYL